MNSDLISRVDTRLAHEVVELVEVNAREDLPHQLQHRPRVHRRPRHAHAPLVTTQPKNKKIKSEFADFLVSLLADFHVNIFFIHCIKKEKGPRKYFFLTRL